MNLGEKSCSNILEIRGNREDVIKFLQGLYGHTSIYNRYNKKQYIQNKKNELKKQKYPTFNTYAKIPEIIELYGYKNFGDSYYIDKWGTLLDTLMFYSQEIDNEINNLISLECDICLSTIYFKTLKTPPIQWVEKCSNLNPRITFILEYTDYKKNKGRKKVKKGVYLQ